MEKRPIIEAGIATAFIGAVATLGVALVGSEDATAQRHAQVQQQAQGAVAEEHKAIIQAQKEVCVAAYGYLGDDTPNKSIPPEYQQRLLESVRQSLEGCSFRSPPSGAQESAPDPAIARPKVTSSFSGQGGSAGGGGASDAH